MKNLLLISLLFIASAAGAQKQYSYNDQVWLSYFNQTRISRHLGIWFDASARTKDNMVQGFSQGIARIGASWIINEAWRFTAGYAYMHHFANSSHPLSDRPEHRPFTMLQWQQQWGGVRLTQTGRLEHRFRHRMVNGGLGEGYNFNHRARYAINVAKAIGTDPFASRTFSLQAGAELFGNFGKEVVNNHFDQVRINAGISYHVNRQTALSLGYLYQLQQFSNGKGFNKLNGMRVTITQQVDLRHKS